MRWPCLGHPAGPTITAEGTGKAQMPMCPCSRQPAEPSRSHFVSPCGAPLYCTVWHGGLKSCQVLMISLAEVQVLLGHEGKESCWFLEENLPLKPVGYVGLQDASCNPTCTSSSSAHHLCMAAMLLRQTHTRTGPRFPQPGSSSPQQQGHIHPPTSCKHREHTARTHRVPFLLEQHANGGQLARRGAAEAKLFSSSKCLKRPHKPKLYNNYPLP